jgi:hypothetical protein
VEAEGPLAGTRALLLRAADHAWGELPRTQVPSGNDEFTVSLWFKPLAPVVDQQALLRKGYFYDSDANKVWTVEIRDGNFVFWVRTPTTNYDAHSSLAITADNWYFLVGVYKGSAPDARIELWVNGVKVDDDTSATGQPNQTGRPIVLGRREAGSWDDMPTGVFANIAFFPTALTTAQIQDLYEVGGP